MKKVFSTLIASVAVFAMTSCFGNKEPSSTATYTLNNSLSYITDLNDDSQLLLAGADYEFEYDFVKSTGKITVKGLQVNALGSRINLLIEDASFKFDEQQVLSISIPNYVSVSDGQHTITDFSLRQVGRVVGGSLNAMYYDLSYVVDGRYKIRALQRSSIFAGTTTIKNLTTGQIETSKTPYFGYSLDMEKRIALVTLFNITIDKVFKNEVNLIELPFTVSDYGVMLSGKETVKALDFSANEIPNFKVTNFSGRISYLPELFVHFQVNEDILIDVTGTYFVELPTNDTTNQ